MIFLAQVLASMMKMMLMMMMIDSSRSVSGLATRIYILKISLNGHIEQNMQMMNSNYYAELMKYDFFFFVLDAEIIGHYLICTQSIIYLV